MLHNLCTIIKNTLNITYRERIKADRNGVVTETSTRGSGNLYQAGKLRRGVNILVSTIGQSLHFLKMGLINFDNLHFFAIDESDQILMPSKSTRCDYLEQMVIPLKVVVL